MPPSDKTKRPFEITFIGCLFIIAGFVGLVYHLHDKPLEQGIVLISLVRLLAIVGGVFLLLGHGWARWLLIAWLAFHVGISAFHSLSQTLMHFVLLLVIVYFLLRPSSTKYFQSKTTSGRNL